MTAVPATVAGIKVVDGENDPATSSRYVNVLLLVHNGSTQVAGGTDTLDVAVNTALSNYFRSGETFTLRAAAIAKPAQSNGTVYAGTISLSGSTVSITPKTESDWSTNATIAASALIGLGRYSGYLLFCTVEVT
jgi:hypothetical protein